MLTLFQVLSEPGCGKLLCGFVQLFDDVAFCVSSVSSPAVVPCAPVPPEASVVVFSIAAILRLRA